MSQISHAFVLPDIDFIQWLQALQPYLKHFERVAVIRSPGGNDLNPYRNVTAVTAPNTWMSNDPLLHIRRIYPQVVRVDVIRATTPQQMASLLQSRIAANDRFGEQNNRDNHIDDRFVLEWATNARPLRITKHFTETPTGTSSDNLGIGIATQAGSKVLSATSGTVTRQWVGDEPDELGLGKYIQVTVEHESKTYIVTYAGLSNVRVPLHTKVAIGDDIGRVSGNDFMLIVQQQGSNRGAYRLPNIVDPTPMLYVTSLRVRPTATGLRVRSVPVDGDIVGTLNPWDMVIPKESHDRVLQKMGVEGQWLRVRTPEGKNGYTAAWFLEATVFEPFALGVNPVGVNLDARHPLGTPDASRLGGIGWVRFGYNVSNSTGSEDIQAAYNRYAPLAEQYVRAGYKVVFTTSHQTYGEAKGFPPWPQMNDSNWLALIDHFADMMARIAQQWAGKGLVHCWQVWNEQDAPIGALASVPMTATNYGRMLQKVVPAIKNADNSVLLVTGGHTSGPGKGAPYARQAISMLNASKRIDGIAFHPYGRGTDIRSPYAQFGHIDESIRAFSAVLPDKPVWITEWGVLDRPNDNPQDIANYATNFISHLKANYPGRIACMIWYAWAQGMHNGFGLVDGNNQPRPLLTERFLQA
ncbi:MAG: peptidoglycan DD-metalloendopeptidase family protein [Anaerolineae bacterium]|nr:peptidoglycan DD-metalloendopeptidase family protein [Anaerolineae bacterium]